MSLGQGKKPPSTEYPIFANAAKLEHYEKFKVDVQAYFTHKVGSFAPMTIATDLSLSHFPAWTNGKFYRFDPFQKAIRFLNPTPPFFNKKLYCFNPLSCLRKQ